MIRSVQFDLTTACSQHCFMCRQYAWKKKEIDLDFLKSKIEEYLNENPNCTFTFSGGDPLSYSKLKELNEYLKKKKVVHYQVFTNLDYDISAKHIEEFLNLAEYVQVSMDGSDFLHYAHVRRSDLYGAPEKLIGYSKRYSRIISNIFSLKSKVKLNMTVSNRNYHDVLGVYCRFKDCENVVGIRFFPVHTDENALLEKEMFDMIENQLDIIKCIDKNGVTNANSFELKPRESYKGKCFIKKEHRVFDANGLEYPCCRATNDNGEEWFGMYSVEKLKGLNDEKVLYDFCSECDRYRKFNEDYENKVNKKEVAYL